MKIVTHGEPWKTGTRRSPGAAEAVRDAHLLGDLLEGHARAPHARHDLVEAARVPLALYLLDDDRRRRRPALVDRELLPGLWAAPPPLPRTRHQGRLRGDVFGDDGGVEAFEVLPRASLQRRLLCLR